MIGTRNQRRWRTASCQCQRTAVTYVARSLMYIRKRRGLPSPHISFPSHFIFLLHNPFVSRWLYATRLGIRLTTELWVRLARENEENPRRSFRIGTGAQDTGAQDFKIEPPPKKCCFFSTSLKSSGFEYSYLVTIVFFFLISKITQYEMNWTSFLNHEFILHEIFSGYPCFSQN